MSRVFLLALTAALNPTLLTATTVLLLLPNPKRLMLGYLAGAFTTGMLVGIVVVEWLSDSGAATDTKQAVSPAIDLAFGLLALIAAYVIQSGRMERRRARRREQRGDEPKEPPRWQTALSGGSARTTYLVGLLLSFPGASYLASLKEISTLDLSGAGVVLTVLAVNAVMLVLLEIPLIGFAIAPEQTPKMIEQFKGWLGRHGSKALVVGLTVIGLLLIVRGVAEIAV
jgi:Sap-like sulfolipid-1-addressing protein